jgi:FkbM family methyltransferase
VFGVLVKDLNSNFILTIPKDAAVSSELRINGMWDSEINSLLHKIVMPGFNVVNVDAYIWSFAIEISKLVGDKGRVYAFEANPYTFEYLILNKEINKANNLVLYQNAVYSDNTVLEFACLGLDYWYHNNGHSGIFTAHESQASRSSYVNHSHKKINVQSVTLDSALSDVEEVDLMLIDAEGAEPNIFQGAINLIDRSKNLVMIMEWSPEMMARHSSVAEFVSIMEKKGFDFANIEQPDAVGNARLVKITKEQMLDNHIFTNLLIARNLDKYIDLVNAHNHD